MEYKNTLKGSFIFETKSFLGRTFKNKKPKSKKEVKLLNLGCGLNIQEDFINADFYRFIDKKLDWQIDLRYNLNCPDDYFDGIFSEHTLEHLYPDDVENLLKELFRILKPGGRIRITVPDVEKYINYYNGEEVANQEDFSKRYASKTSALRNVSQNFLHISLWDFNEMKRYLEDAGFTEIEKSSFGESKDKRLLLDLKDRAWETLYMEAVKQ